MKATQVERRLRKLGFVLLRGRGKGSHRVYQHPDGRFVVVSDKRGTVPRGTLQNIKRAILPDRL